MSIMLTWEKQNGNDTSFNDLIKNWGYILEKVYVITYKHDISVANAKFEPIRSKNPRTWHSI
jgi:hypothetical protein